MGKSSLPFWGTAAVVVAVLLGVLQLIHASLSTLAPEPYMDEIFHVPQTQAFCAGHWHHWDDKITTLPGLYLAAVAIQRMGAALHMLFPESVPAVMCSTSFLRQVNHLFAALTVVTIALILRHLHGHAIAASRPLWLWLRALFIALFSPLSFFYSLYYTDAGSSFAVLATYYLSLRASAAARPSSACTSPGFTAGAGWQLAAGAAGAAAVVFRQTNAVWVGLILAVGVLSDVHATGSLGADDSEGERSAVSPAASEARSATERKGKNAIDSSLLQAPAAAWSALLSLARSPLPVLRRWPLIAVLLSFALFVYANGGIVVGDKSNHQPTKHLAQLCYAAAVATTAIAPASFVFMARSALGPISTAARPSLRSSARALVCAAAILLCAAACVRWGTLSHPFMLADNRHLPFYLWRRVISPFPSARYLLVPLYAAAAALVDASLARAARAGGALAVAGQPLARAGAYLCAAAALVPSPLIEPRYFVVPWIWVALHQPSWQDPGRQGKSQWKEAAADCVWLAGAIAVNVAAWALFLFRPFLWPDGSVARFMW